MEQPAAFRPYVIGQETLSAPDVHEILSGRDKALADQLADHNRRVLQLNGDAKAELVDAVMELSHNTNKVIGLLTKAEVELVRSLNDDPRLAGLAVPSRFSGYSGKYVRSTARRLLMPDEVSREYTAHVTEEWESIAARIEGTEVEAIQAIFGDRYVWKRIHQSSHESRTTGEFVDSVGVHLDSASKAGKRPIHSATDGLLYVWVHIARDRHTRRVLISDLSSTEATQEMLQRYFVWPPRRYVITSEAGIIWLPDSRSQNEAEGQGVPRSIGTATLRVIHLDEEEP